MALLTASQIKAIVSIEAALDPSFFALNIDYAQTEIIKPILTEALYNAYVAYFLILDWQKIKFYFFYIFTNFI